MWNSHDSEFKIIQRFGWRKFDGARCNQKDFNIEENAMNSREKMKMKWEHRILFNSIQILEYQQARLPIKLPGNSSESISWKSGDQTVIEYKPTSDGPSNVQFSLS